jgi:hypothetical protein
MVLWLAKLKNCSTNTITQCCDPFASSFPGRNKMALNPVIDMLGRRLRLADSGGGRGSFIGAMHRQSARRDDRYQLVTGIFSSDQAKSQQDA